MNLEKYPNIRGLVYLKEDVTIDSKKIARMSLTDTEKLVSLLEEICTLNFEKFKVKNFIDITHTGSQEYYITHNFSGINNVKVTGQRAKDLTDILLTKSNKDLYVKKYDIYTPCELNNVYKVNICRDNYSLGYWNDKDERYNRERLL